MRDRLIELVSIAREKCDLTSCYDCEYQEVETLTKCFSHLIADYLLANGVIVPPCEVGDIVYAVSLNTETNIVAVHRGYIGSIDIRSSGNYIFICHEGFDDEPYFKSICGKFEDFGKTVFLARKEAEQALKGEHHAEIH